MVMFIPLTGVSPREALAAARSLLATEPGQAAERAILARSMFGTQQREGWRIHASASRCHTRPALPRARLTSGTARAEVRDLFPEARADRARRLSQTAW